MKVETKKIQAKLIELVAKVVSAEEAEYFASEIIEAHIRKSPRNNVLKSAVSDVEKSIELSKAEVSYDIDLPSYVSINFNGHGPLTYIKKIHDDIEKRANANGIAMFAFTNGQSMHTLHVWVQGLAKRGLVAIAVCNGGPRSVVPFNGTKGVLGTNPIAYGLPGAEGEIFCVDMATSEIPYFEILDSKKDGELLRENSAVDSQGEFTRDSNEALDFYVSKTDPTSNLVPMGGGYKGYYIVYLMEVLTSALIGMPSSPEMSNDYVAAEHGSILIAMSPKAFGTNEKFESSIAELNQAIRSQKPKEGNEVRLPGESNNQKLEQAGNTVEVDAATAKKLGLAK